MRASKEEMKRVKNRTVTISPVFSMKDMLQSGELRHTIIKRNLNKKQLNLKSIDFKSKYNIKDLLRGKVDLGFKSETVCKSPVSLPVRPRLKLPSSKAVEIYSPLSAKSRGKESSKTTAMQTTNTFSGALTYKKMDT